MGHAGGGGGARRRPCLVTPLPPARAPGLRGPWGALRRPYCTAVVGGWRELAAHEGLV